MLLEPIDPTTFSADLSCDMDYEKKAELDKLIGRVETDRTYEKQRERDRQIEERRRLHRFRELKTHVLGPVLKGFMGRLQEGGHLARLRDVGPTKLRFDLMLESHAKTAGLIEFELNEEDSHQVQVSCLRNLHPVLVEKIPLEDLDEDAVTDILIRFMKVMV